jgi:signal transduction histidine kinase
MMSAEDMQKSREQLIEELDALRARVASLELTQAALDALAPRIAVLDENGTILRANRAWREFAAVGLVPECQVSEGADYLAVCDADIGVNAEAPNRFSAGILDVMRGVLDEFKTEYRCCIASEWRWFEGRACRLGGQESPRVVISHVDMSERKSVEEALRESRERLEDRVRERTVEFVEANRALQREIRQAQESLRQSTQLRMEAEKLAATGRLAAQIAHEINNPLAGITNAMRLFRDAIPQDAPEFAYLDRTEREVLRIGRIVRQMYDLHRPNQEREVLTRIDEMVEEVPSMLESLSRQHEVRIEVEQPLPRVRACMPEGTLRQILYGLLANAIEASAPGGEVRVGMAVKEGLLVVSISDHGHGIPQEFRHRIFEPFFSTKAGTGTEGGLGLGLPLAKQLAEAMGGNLSYESEVGRGTMFHICLPLGRIQGVVI